MLRAWGSLPGGLHPTVPLAISPSAGPTPHLDTSLSPQPTYQKTRPLAPYTDGLWHRSPIRRDPPQELVYSLGAALSLPLGHCPFLAGFLGAPIRDDHSSYFMHATRDRATRVSLSPSPSPDCLGSANAFHTRLITLARHSITHIVHLVTGTEIGCLLRLRTVAELSSPLSSSRNDHLPRWLCEELIAAIPSSVLQVITESAAIRAADPSLSLRDLCSL